MLKRLAVLAFVSLAACGSPEAGDSCSPENAATCGDNVTVLLCESSVLKAYACRGRGGCVSNSSTAVCDFEGARAGDACPRINENKGLCDSSDANRALLCKSNVWTAQTCKSCAIQNNSIVCVP